MTWLPCIRDRWREVQGDAERDVWARTPENLEEPLPLEYPGGDDEEQGTFYRLARQIKKRGEIRWRWRKRILTAMYAVFTLSDEIRWRSRRGIT